MQPVPAVVREVQRWKHPETLRLDSKYVCQVRYSATVTAFKIHCVNGQFSWNFTKTLVSDGFEIKTITSLLEIVGEALRAGGQRS